MKWPNHKFIKWCDNDLLILLWRFNDAALYKIFFMTILPLFYSQLRQMVNLNAKMSLGFIVFTFFKTMVPNVRFWEKKSCFLLKKKIFWWNYSNFCVKIIKKGLKFLLLSASSKKISASRAVGISASSSASKLPASSSTTPAQMPWWPSPALLLPIRTRLG